MPLLVVRLPPEERLEQRRLCVVLLVAVVMVTSLGVGSSSVRPTTTLQTLGAHLLPGEHIAEWSLVEVRIVWSFRTPRLAGGESVFTAEDGMFSDFFAAEVGPEAVLAKDPDAFVFSVNNAKHEKETIDYLISTFAETSAVREGRLVAVDNTFIQPGTLAAIEGVRVVTEGLHG